MRPSAAGPVLPLKDPTSDMAVIARGGSKLVKDVRDKKEANKSRARFWEMAGSKMGKITGEAWRPGVLLGCFCWCWGCWGRGWARSRVRRGPRGLTCLVGVFCWCWGCWGRWQRQLCGRVLWKAGGAVRSRAGSTLQLSVDCLPA